MLGWKRELGKALCSEELTPIPAVRVTRIYERFSLFRCDCFLPVGCHLLAIDIDGNYMIVKGLRKIISAVFVKRNSTVLVRFEAKNEQRKIEMITIQIDISAALNEVSNAKVDDPDSVMYSLKSPIVILNSNP